MIWEKSNRFDQRAREIADRHYNRQKRGELLANDKKTYKGGFGKCVTP